MQRPFLSLLAVTVLSLPAAAFAQDGPTPFPDEKDSSAWPGEGPIRLHNWMNDNRNFFWKRREADQGAVVLVGDSLIGGWAKRRDLLGLPETKIANRGIGGDVTRGILFRFKEDVLDLNPAAIVICAGTNDLSAHANPDAVAGNLSKILDQIAEKNSSLPVVLCTIPPRDNPKAPLKSPDAVNQLNEEIKLLAAARDNVELLDVFAALSTSEGKPNPDYFGQDLLHLSPEGYKKWAEVLAPAIAKAVNK